MRSYSVQIKHRPDGGVVASAPRLSKAVGYGLNPREALFEFFKAWQLRPERS